MTRTGIVAISRLGSVLASSLATALGGDVTLYVQRRYHQEGEPGLPFDPPARGLVGRLFQDHQRLVLFMPVGAAVRLLAPFLKDKHSDPAVVCVDDAGRFAVSLLSGHLGGADTLAQEVAEALGATPVITSASHVTGTLAVDLLGQEFGWQIEEEPGAVTRASAAMVNGEPVGVYQDAGETHWWPADRPLPANLTIFPSLEAVTEARCAAALIISDRATPAVYLSSGASEAKAVVVYRPQTLVVGMGCRRGVPVEELEALLVSTFDSHDLALASLRCIATAELKREEPGILDLADKYGVPVLCYSAEELNSVFENIPAIVPSLREGGEGGEDPAGPTPRPRVRQLLGMWGVSEPAALLAAGGKELLVPRIKTPRATIAVARVVFSGNQGSFATEAQRSQS